jgi:hypothetical protein
LLFLLVRFGERLSEKLGEALRVQYLLQGIF